MKSSSVEAQLRAMGIDGTPAVTTLAAAGGFGMGRLGLRKHHAGQSCGQRHGRDEQMVRDDGHSRSCRLIQQRFNTKPPPSGFFFAPENIVGNHNEESRLTWLQKIRNSIRENSSWHPMGVVFGLAVTALLVAYTVLISWYIKTVWDGTKTAVAAQELGQLGDFLGGVLNPLLSLVSVVGLFVTLIFALAQLEESSNATTSARKQSELATRLGALDSMLRTAEERVNYYSALPRLGDSSRYRQEINSWTARRDEIAEEIEIIFVRLRTEAAPDIPLPPTIAAANEERERRWGQEGYY